MQPPPRDLTDPDQNARVLELADELLGDRSHLDQLIAAMADHRRLASLDPVLVEAASCARSARDLSDSGVGFHVSVVWAMYRETDRMMPRHAHPHGEDFLRAKAAQMRWLAERADVPLSWHAFAVDDGCPAQPSSAERAAEIVAEADLGDEITVLRLADAIAERLPVTDHFATIETTDDSRKGGSIAYGMWHAVRATERVPAGHEHVVLYTDADLSANLAQGGSLLAALTDGAAAAAGQRYGVPGTVLIKEAGAVTEPVSTGGKPDKTIIVFRNFVRAVLVPALAQVLDTQAGFKAFRADVAAEALGHLAAFTESFDVELLLHAARVAASPIAPVPIVFTEDFAATNFPSVDPSQRHLDMVTQIIEIHDRLVAPHHEVSPDATSLRTFIETLSVEDYISVIEALRAHDSATSEHDPLFESRWPVDHLTNLIG